MLFLIVGSSFSNSIQTETNPFAENHISQHLLIGWSNSNSVCNSQVRYAVIDYAGNQTNTSKGKCVGLLLETGFKGLVSTLTYLKSHSTNFAAVIFDDYSLQTSAFDGLYSNFSSILPVIPVEYCIQFCINSLANAAQYSNSVIFVIGWHNDFILPQSAPAETWNTSIVSDALHLHYQNVFILVYESSTSFQRSWSQNYINGTITASQKFAGLVVWNGQQF